MGQVLGHVCVSLCVSVTLCVCVGACMLVCVWYTELMCNRMYGLADIMGQVQRRVCLCMFRCMHACVCVVYRADVYTGCMA